jgi:hypothetical protein
MKLKNLILTARKLFVTTALSAGLLVGGMIFGSSVSTPAAAQQDRGPWDFQGTKRPAKKNIEEGGSGGSGANHANTDADDDSDSSDDDDDNADNADDGADGHSGNNPNPYYNPNSSSPCHPPNKHGCKTSHPQ